MQSIFVSDFTFAEYPGGAEKVDETIYKTFLPSPFIKCRELRPDSINPNITYIISNFTGLSQQCKDALIANGNYVILEHDYKLHPTRQPNQFPEETFPVHERINLGFLAGARAIFLQSQDHIDCYRKNVPELKNLVQLVGSIWSEEELDYLDSVREASFKSHKMAVVNSDNVFKGRDRAKTFCEKNKIDYSLVGPAGHNDFLAGLAQYSTLVYLPIVKESFCKLVVEAKALNLNVITTFNYGASKEHWFDTYGKEMTDFLRKATRSNIQTIYKYL